MQVSSTLGAYRVEDGHSLRSRNALVLRRLIIAEIILLVVAIPVALVEQRYLPPDAKAVLDRHAEGEMTIAEWVVAALSLPWIVLAIWSWVALWQLKRIGRPMYTGVWIVTLPVYFIDPVEISGPTAALLTELSTLVAGLILGLTYFSDLRAHFDRRT